MGVDVKKELLTRDYSELTVLRGSRGGFTGLGIGVQENVKMEDGKGCRGSGTRTLKIKGKFQSLFN